GVCEDFVEVGRSARLRVACAEALERVRRGVAEPAEIGQIVEVAREVRAPVAEAYQGHPGHSFHTFPLTWPFLPVALRKSTTRWACSTTSPESIAECAVTIATQSYAPGS